MTLKPGFLVAALAALAFTAPAAMAQQQGVSKDEITLGSIQDLSGPLAGFGKQARLGMMLAVDEINEQAVAAIHVVVAAVAGNDVTVTTQDLTQGAEYAAGNVPFTPDPQPDPDPATRALTLDTTDAVLGWTKLDYTFHAGDPDGRGGYLRSVQIDADAATGLASGHANNYSPGTQLSGFVYDFAGTVEAIAVPGAAITRASYTAELPAALDDGGVPVVTTFPL